MDKYSDYSNDMDKLPLYEQLLKKEGNSVAANENKEVTGNEEDRT